MSNPVPTLSPEAAAQHQPQHVPLHMVHDRFYGSHWLGRLNRAIAVRITAVVGNMWAAYAFAGLALISLPAALHTHDPLIIVAWVAQTFLQLVLLPIILVGQNVQAEANETRARADHDTLLAIHRLSVAVYELQLRETSVALRDQSTTVTPPDAISGTTDQPLE
jgi:hypothetical protein